MAGSWNPQYHFQGHNEGERLAMLEREQKKCKGDVGREVDRMQNSPHKFDSMKVFFGFELGPDFAF